MTTSEFDVKLQAVGKAVIKLSQNAILPPVFGVPPPEIAVPPLEVVIPSPGNVFMVHTVFFGQLILRKPITTVATRCQILMLKAPNSISVGAPPQTLLGELTVIPQTPCLDLRGILL